MGEKGGWFDLAEMAEIFSNSDPSDDLVTSNHSYGPEHGFTFFPTNGGLVNYLDVNTNTISQINLPPSNNYRIWRGDASISTNEEFAFGFYSADLTAMIDATVYSSETILPDC